jgi:hypothetical protein
MSKIVSYLRVPEGGGTRRAQPATGSRPSGRRSPPRHEPRLRAAEFEEVETARRDALDRRPQLKAALDQPRPCVARSSSADRLSRDAGLSVA